MKYPAISVQNYSALPAPLPGICKTLELGSSFDKAWFPEGKEDPSIMVICVDVDSVEYWEAASSKMVQVAAPVKLLVTGEPDRPGENETIDMNTGAVEDLHADTDPSWNKVLKSKETAGTS